MPLEKNDCCSATVGACIYVIGDDDSDECVYDTTTDTWTRFTSVCKNEFNVAVSVGKYMYIIGGTPDAQDVYYYDTENDTRGTVNLLPNGGIYLSATVHDDKIYVIGGSVDSGTAYEFDTVEIYIPKYK